VTSGAASSSGPDIEHVVWSTLTERRPDDGDSADRQPEWRLHRDLYRERAEVGAIIRSRPICATALACMPAIRRTGIPFFHLDVSVAGGDSIRCAADAPLGSPAWSDQVLDALQDRTACLLANRGLLVTGATLAEAAATTVEIEALAQIYCQVLQLQATAAGDEAPPRQATRTRLAGEGRR
jgi:L-fuculose-phosphate aldolase